MRWAVLGFATLVAAAAVLLGGVASSPAPTPVRLELATYVPASDSVQGHILALVNEQRERHGCARPVVANRALMVSARRHTSRMIARGALTHTVPGEPPLRPRVERAGYTRPSILAENIAFGFASARGVVRGWMHSPMHRGVLLDCRLRHIGVSKMASRGVAWWTLDLGRR